MRKSAQQGGDFHLGEHVVRLRSPTPIRRAFRSRASS
jgi:hypothetical protein